MNYLFITESFYHNPSPNGNCVYKIAQALIRNGHKVTVLALENQMVSTKETIDNINVYRVKTYMEWKLMYNKKLPGLLSEGLQRVIRTLKLLMNPLHPFRSPGVLLGLYIKGKEIVRNEKIDVVVGVHRDFETALCGALLKKHFPQLRSVLYMLDSLSDGVCSNPGISPEKHKIKCEKWELFFAKHYDYLCPMTSHKQIFNKVEFEPYKSKIFYVDIPNLNMDWLSDGMESRKSNDELSFVFTGMLSETNADCSFFLHIFPYILQIQPARFDIYGGISKYISEKLNETKLLNKAIFFHGRVSQDELIEIRKGAEIFVNFGNEHECGIPCKIFEYMSTGKCIISFKKIQNDASEAYLIRYKKALILQEDYNKQLEYAHQILDFIKENEQTQMTARQLLNEFRVNTPEHFAGFLEKI